MRTTLTLDPYVAVQLERLRADTREPLKQLVNDLLRAGLATLEDAPERRGPYTQVVSLGRPLLPDMADISEVLAIAEGEDHR